MHEEKIRKSASAFPQITPAREHVTSRPTTVYIPPRLCVTC